MTIKDLVESTTFINDETKVNATCFILDENDDLEIRIFDKTVGELKEKDYGWMEGKAFTTWSVDSICKKGLLSYLGTLCVTYEFRKEPCLEQ